MAEEFSVRDFKVGDRIRLHPATDLFMRGIRFATVTRVGLARVLATSDQGRELNLSVTHIIEIVEPADTQPTPRGLMPLTAPDPNAEHPFQADPDHPLYCLECGASETDHRL